MNIDEQRTQQLMAAYPVLASLPEATRTQLLQHSRWITVAAATVLFDERQRCEAFPFVIEGSVRVMKTSASGRELPLYRVTRGETCVISSSCMLASEPYNVRGVSEVQTVLMLLPNADFNALLVEAEFRRFVFHLFAERIAELMQLVEDVAFHRLDERLAACLLGKGPLLHLTHQQLADELGSVREMISRLLKGFASQGLVQLGREQIRILDPAGLRRLGGGAHPPGAA